MTIPEIGLLLFSDHTIAELAELASLAETLGHRDFWYTDVRFARDCYLGLAAAAARTGSCGITSPATAKLTCASSCG